MDDPSGMLLEILEMRAYARMKTEIDRAREDRTGKAKAPTGDLATLVLEIEREVLKAKREEVRAGGNR